MAASKNGRIALVALLLAALALSAQLAPAAAASSHWSTWKPPPSVPCPPPPATPMPATPTPTPATPTPTPATPTPTPATPMMPMPATPMPTPATPMMPTPATPMPTPAPSTPTGKCPVDTLKLLACVDALNGLVNAVVGANTSSTCCPLLDGVADLDAALCLCTVIKLEALDLKLVLPVAISVLVNDCGKNVPSSFQCP